MPYLLKNLFGNTSPDTNYFSAPMIQHFLRQYQIDLSDLQTNPRFQKAEYFIPEQVEKEKQLAQLIINTLDSLYEFQTKIDSVIKKTGKDKDPLANAMLMLVKITTKLKLLGAYSPDDNEAKLIDAVFKYINTSVNQRLAIIDKKGVKVTVEVPDKKGKPKDKVVKEKLSPDWQEMFAAIEKKLPLAPKVEATEPEPIPNPVSTTHINLDEDYPGCFQIGRQLGSGNFGSVTEYIIPEKINGKPNPLLSRLRQDGLCRSDDNRIAVKTSVQNLAQSELEKFINESEIGNTLRLDALKENDAKIKAGSDFQTFYTLSELGYKDGNPIIICRFEPAGRCDNFLEKLNADPGPLGQTDRSLLLGKWLLQATRGLKRMHNAGFLHLDIAARNMLVDNKGNAYISDFGLSDKMNEQQKAVTKEGDELPLRWIDHVRSSKEPAIPPSDFFALRIKLIEDLLNVAVLSNDDTILFNKDSVTVIKNVMEHGETVHISEIYDQLETAINKKRRLVDDDITIKKMALDNLLINNPPDSITDSLQANINNLIIEQKRLQQVSDVMVSFSSFLIADNALEGLTVNQRLANIYITQMGGMAKLSRKNNEFAMIYNEEARNDLGEAVFKHCVKMLQEIAAIDENGNKTFHPEGIKIFFQYIKDLDASFRVDLKVPQFTKAVETAFKDCVAVTRLENYDVNDEVVLKALNSISKVYVPENDIESLDVEQEETLVEGALPDSPEVDEIIEEVEEVVEEVEPRPAAPIPVSPPIAALPVNRSHSIPETEFAAIYQLAKNPDIKPVDYPILQKLNELKIDFQVMKFDFNQALQTLEKEIKETEKNGFKIYQSQGNEYLIRYTGDQKLDGTNTLHPNEAEIQALRYLRGMLYIAQGSGALETFLLTNINAAWQDYLASTVNPADRTHELHDNFANILDVQLGVGIEKARKQLTIARDLGISLETRQAICTISKDNNKLVVEQADLVKLSPEFFDSHFSNPENQAWFKVEEKTAGINHANRSNPGMKWLNNFYKNHFEQLKINGMPAASSSSFDPRPINLQKVVTSVVTLNEDRVELDTVTSATFYRLGSIAPAKIHKTADQLAYAKARLNECIKVTLQDALQNFYNNYATAIPPGETPDFFINYQTLLSPWLAEYNIPKFIYTDNNGLFVKLAKEAMASLAYNNSEFATKVINNKGEEVDLKVKLNLYQTNAAINKRTAFGKLNNPAIATYATDKESRLAKIASTNRFLEKTLKIPSIAALTKEQLDANVSKLNAGGFSDLSKNLQRELALRMQASFNLRELLNGKNENYKTLSVYQRNIMMASLEFIVLGNQALAFDGCKSARDRTAIFGAAQKTMLENPKAMADWNTLNAGIIKSLIQGHHFRAMVWHTGVAKIGAVHSHFLKALPSTLQSGIERLKRFSKPLIDLAKQQGKVEKTLKKIDIASEPLVVAPPKTEAVVTNLPPPKTPQEIQEQKDLAFSKHLTEFFDTERKFRADMNKLTGFFLDASGKLKKDTDILAINADIKGRPINLSPAMREKLESFLTVYQALLPNPLEKARDINSLLDTINADFKNFGKQLQDAVALKEDQQLFQDYVQTFGGFKRIDNLSTDDYFIKATQRLTKYPLLLKELESNATDPALKEKIAQTKASVEGMIQQFNEALKTYNPVTKQVIEPVPSASAIINNKIKAKMSQLIGYKTAQQAELANASFLTKGTYEKRVDAVNSILDKLTTMTAQDQLTYLNNITNPQSDNYIKAIDTHIGFHSGPTTFKTYLENSTPAQTRDDPGLGLTNLLTKAVEEKQKYETKIETEYAIKHGLPVTTPEEQKLREQSAYEIVLKALEAEKAARGFASQLFRYHAQTFFAKTTPEAKTAPTPPPRMTRT